MSEKGIAQLITDVKKYAKKVSDGKIPRKQSLASLMDAGIVDSKGELKRPYSGK